MMEGWRVRTYLCRMGDLMSEFGISDLKQVYVVNAESFEDAGSKIFPRMEVREPLSTGHDDTRLINARFLPANEMEITKRYQTSGYCCQRHAWVTEMPEGWNMKTKRPKVRRQVSLEAFA